LGCHSSTGTSALQNFADGSKIPIVFNMGGYPDPALAGGNFYFVSLGGANNDTKGHNIFSDDINFSEDLAPGDDGRACGNDSCHNNLYAIYTGDPPDIRKYGCLGCHLDPQHHANDHPHLQGGLVTQADQGWYRFLSGHLTSINHGVEGYEDGDWQHSSSAGDHNEYKGDINVGGSGLLASYHTTTGFCSGCHPNFHSDQGGPTSPFLRHPSDSVIPAWGEYATAFGGVYDPMVPVARPDLPSSPDPAVHVGTDMVMCLSCHRAHGSPYDAILRWDYKSWPGGGYNGCGICHTSKD
jgi:predicted CXXCH cytochrome family protein